MSGAIGAGSRSYPRAGAAFATSGPREPDVVLSSGEESRRYRAFWIAVLIEGLKSCFEREHRGVKNFDPRKPSSWESSRDLEMICDLAGFDVSRVRAFIAEERAAPIPGSRAKKLQAHHYTAASQADDV